MFWEPTEHVTWYESVTITERAAQVVYLYFVLHWKVYFMLKAWYISEAYTMMIQNMTYSWTYFSLCGK